MDGHQYEYECAKNFKKRGFKHVVVTPNSGDHGIDVLATYDNKKYAIQCKYYSGPVGNKAVQEAFTGCRFYKYDVPVVLTNSTFTKSAIQEATEVGVLLWPEGKIPLGNFNISNEKTSHEYLFCVITFILAVILTVSLYKYLGIFPIALVIIGLVMYLLSIWSDRRKTDTTVIENAEKSRMSDDEALAYGAMCEKHMRNQKYMESLGLNPDDYDDQ